MVPLSRVVGKKNALEMLFTGRFISAGEAKEYGLINRVVPKEKLDQETWALATEIAQYSLDTLNRGKRAFYDQIKMTESQAYQYAKEVISTNAQTEDAIEGMSAFLEGRPPVWKEK